MKPWIVHLLFILEVYGFARPKTNSGGLGFGSPNKNQPKQPPSPVLRGYKRDDSPVVKEMIDLLLELECEGLEPDVGAVEIGFGLATGGMRGVFAREDLGAGEFIMAVPFPATLVVMDDEGESTTDAQRGLILLRKYLDPSVPETQWRPYLDCLPTKEFCFDPTPDFWTDDEILLLEFPRIVNEAFRRKKQVQQLAVEEGVDCDQLQFATWLAKSRCFSILKVRDGHIKTKSVLIPFFDMINHSSNQPNAELQLVEAASEDESFYAIRTTRAIPAGTEITISYGTKSDSSVEHLMNYGLIEESNKFDIEMLQYGGEDCLNRMEDWSTTLEEDFVELKTAVGNRRTALMFRTRMKKAIEEANL